MSENTGRDRPVPILVKRLLVVWIYGESVRCSLLQKEIQRANTPQFKRKLAELLALEGLLYMWQRTRVQYPSLRLYCTISWLLVA